VTVIFLWVLPALVIGAIPRNPVIILVGLLTPPVLAHVTGQPPVTVWASGGMLALVVLKRLEANREPLPAGSERWRVLARRLLLDRDIEDWEAWVSRPPKRATL
jgi:hypothetical protein